MQKHSGNIINSTCKQCADISKIFDYKFCVTSLQAVPISHHADLEGLGMVAMELALENATRTITTIEKMIASKKYDPFVVGCLRDCLKLYANAVSKIVMAIGAFLSNHFGAANVFLSGVVEKTVTCEAGFRQKKGEANPLVKQNHNLFEICVIGLCIIDLVSLEHSLSS
ncbi:hypothetical protein ACH5RR_040417 [Cinchona calisaya]|uniref:Pectinesterase inhibitor domain-containing protein n=1 Tax=Cinchona calisaya TaxID=153742 RepID=A0ABD2XUR7_9GENT